MITVCNAVNKRLREFLDDKKMTPYRFGKDNAIHQNTLKNLLRESNPSVNLKTVLQICKGLGIAPAQFFDSPIFTSDELDIE